AAADARGKDARWVAVPLRAKDDGLAVGGEFRGVHIAAAEAEPLEGGRIRLEQARSRVDTRSESEHNQHRPEPSEDSRAGAGSRRCGLRAFELPGFDLILQVVERDLDVGHALPPALRALPKTASEDRFQFARHAL